jgi:hypothetical protein
MNECPVARARSRCLAAPPPLRSGRGAVIEHSTTGPGAAMDRKRASGRETTESLKGDPDGVAGRVNRTSKAGDCATAQDRASAQVDLEMAAPTLERANLIVHRSQTWTDQRPECGWKCGSPDSLDRQPNVTTCPE